MNKLGSFPTRLETKPSGPVRTFNEIAELFGMHPSVLRHVMGTSRVTPPEPFNTYRATVSASQRSYYELRAMQAWWKAHNEEKRARS